MELALELILENEGQTRRLHDFLEAHMWQGWRSKKQTSYNYDETIYSGGKTARNRFTIYADRPSKITGEVHCCKVEWRVNRKQPCEAKGLSTFPALHNFGHFGFWRTHLRLAKFDVDKLQRDYCRKFKRRLPRYKRNASATPMLPWPTISPTSCGPWPCRRRWNTGR